MHPRREVLRTWGDPAVLELQLWRGWGVLWAGPPWPSREGATRRRAGLGNLLVVLDEVRERYLPHCHDTAGSNHQREAHWVWPLHQPHQRWHSRMRMRTCPWRSRLPEWYGPV